MMSQTSSMETIFFKKVQGQLKKSLVETYFKPVLKLLGWLNDEQNCAVIIKAKEIFSFRRGNENSANETEQVLSLITKIQFSLINILVNIINGFTAAFWINPLFHSLTGFILDKLFDGDENKYEHLHALDYFLIFMASVRAFTLEALINSSITQRNVIKKIWASVS